MGAITFPYSSRSEEKHWLVRPIAWRITPALILLGLITLLSLGLHLYHIQSIGNANAYYTAAVKSMLQSWHNFFFVSAEPGGSVTVDKPPLGFWIQTAFAAVLGVSGFSVTLPNILAGVFSVPLLYHLIKKYFGVGAGLVAALALALTPVSLAVDRNNTIDGMLIFTLLLAAWAFIKATETGRLKYLLLGALLVGLGFNIKMMQAFLPLPAFYALYFFGAKTGWGKKILHLALASLLLAVVSLSWAVAVDLTPPSQRPYVGSTTSNSEMELIFGYNGINRLLGRMRPGSIQTNPSGANAVQQFFSGSSPDGRSGGPAGGGGMFNTGTPGPLRFFQAPLAKEMSWLLPFGLISLLLAAVTGFADRGGLPEGSRWRRYLARLFPLANEHQGLILWGGWLVTCLVFFNMAGFFHNYYLGTIAPALAAVVGMGFYSLQKIWNYSRLLAVTGLLLAAGVTILFQLYLVGLFGLYGIWAYLALGCLVAVAVLGLFHLVARSSSKRVFNQALALALVAMLVIPGVWSVRTVSAGTSGALPEAYSGDHSGRQGGGSFRGGGGGNFAGGGPGGAFPGGPGGSVDSSLLTYLQTNTQAMKYLVAVPSSQEGSNLVLETGRPVLFMGGFTGSDPVVSADSLSKLVSSGQLRYILYGGMGGRGRGGSSAVSAWIQTNCSLVNNVSSTNPRGSTLYDCVK